MASACSLSLVQAAELARTGQVSAKTLVTDALDRAAVTEPVLSACITLAGENALAAAEALDKNPPPSAALPLRGLPLVVSDAVAVKGLPFTAGSAMLEGFAPAYEATAVGRLRQAGAIVLAKSNLDEFGLGNQGLSAFCQTKNPWDLSRSPGGASAGAAASVSASQSFGGLALDSGGSALLPAAFCGCAAFRPSFGRVSRHGAAACVSSMDQLSPVARSVEDCAALLQIIAGPDQADALSVQAATPDFPAALAGSASLQGLKIGVPKQFWEGAEDAPAKAGRMALAVAESLGAELIDLDLPILFLAREVYAVIACAEVSTNLGRYDGIRYGKRVPGKDLDGLYLESRTHGLGERARLAALLGAHLLSKKQHDVYFQQACRLRGKLCRQLEAALAGCDILAALPSQGLPPPLAASPDSLAALRPDPALALPALAGLPALTLPVGTLYESNLPAALLLIGRAFDDATPLRAGHVLQKQLGLPGHPRAVPQI